MSAAELFDETALGGGADKSAFVQRLRLILTQWPSADRLARTMGVSPSAFRKWLKGEAEPSRERLIALARATNVRLAWLAEGEGPEPDFGKPHASRRRGGGEAIEDTGDWGQFVIPGFAAPAFASQPMPHIALRRDWLRSIGCDPGQVICDIVTSDAMAPAIRKGDAILVDTSSQSVRSGAIYQLTLGGDRVLARVQCRHDGGLILLSDNSLYHAELVDRAMAENLVVIGRVVWAGGVI